MRGINAGYIVQEYKLKQAYAKSKRQKCKEKPCKKCRFEQICEDREEYNEV